MHYNGDGASYIIMAMMALRFFGCLMYATVGPKPTVRTSHCCVRVLALGCVISGRCNMRSQFHPHAPFCCPMALAALRLSLFAKYILERISYSP